MHVVTNTRRRGEREYTTTLLRRSYREQGKVKKETLANLSHLPPELVELIRRHLRGERLVPTADALSIERSRPHGHVAAALAMARRLELPRLLERSPSRERDLCLAMVVGRLLSPGSKLATARSLGRSTLAEELGVQGASEDDLYSALDWLAPRQEKIEARLARRHLGGGDHVLYDLSSSYFEGRHCPLATRGYSRDGKRGTLQITYGLLTDAAGRPVAVEVFAGNVHDHETLRSQLTKLRERFGLARVVVVADRGMATRANVEALAASGGTGFITALSAPQVKRLARAGSVQPTLFDEQNLAEVESPDFPGERLVVCRNPLVAEERWRKREDLLRATEAELAQISARVGAGRLVDAGEIGMAVGEVVKRFRMKKHFDLEIAPGRFAFARRSEQIAEEAALDGIYVLRTSVSEPELRAPEVVSSYKQLARVERAFRDLKGPDLCIRPIHHRLEGRVRAHVFLCMLALYLECHLRERWRELTFADEEPPERPDPVAKAQRSRSAEAKAKRKANGAGQPVGSFRDVLAELSLQTKNTVRLAGTEATFDQLSKPTALGARALELVEE